MINNKILSLMILLISSCALDKTNQLQDSNVPTINTISYEANSISCTQEMLGANKPRVRGDEMSPVIEHYDYFDCIDSKTYEAAFDEANKTKKISFIDKSEAADQAELNEDEDEDLSKLNCKPNIASISSKGIQNNKYYDCVKSLSVGDLP
tara:strand:+ start:2099 stop:2551 length:453 start_codon:yes stop_codon:yes gene_type:complete